MHLCLHTNVHAFSGYMFFGFLLLLATGCRQNVFIADELPETDSMTPVDSNGQTDSASGNDTGIDSTTGSLGGLDTETLNGTASEDTAIDDTSSDTLTDFDTDTGTDTASDTETMVGTDTGTVSPCPILPAGSEILSEEDAASFEGFGEGNRIYTSVSGPTFSNAWQFETEAITNTTTGTQLQHLIPADITAGDHVVVEFWTRCISADSGQCHVGAIVEQSTSPWTNLGQYFETVGTDWQFHQVPMVAGTAFAANDTHITYRLGYENQVIQLFPVRVINYGRFDNESRPECLPNTTELLTSVAIISEPRSDVFVDIVYDYFIEVNGLPSAAVTITGLPAWLTLDKGRRHLWGAPTYADVGTHSNIVIEAENVNGTVSQSFSIMVSVDPALVGHWPLDESGGTVAVDASGNGRDGIVTGDPVWQPSDGRVDGSLHCDGYTGQIDYVMLPSDATMDGIQNGPHTITAWVRAESIPAGAVESDNDFGFGILMKPGYHVGLWYDAEQRFRSDYQFSNDEYKLIGPQRPPGIFYHLAAKMNPSENDYALFVGGIPVSSATLNGTETLRNYGTIQWRIGVADQDAPAYGWYADISVDDVRIYNKALSDHEIRSLAEFWQTEK